MKKLLQKTVGSVVALALAVSCLGLPLTASAAEDLALSATAFGSETNGQNTQPITAINDGSETTLWRSKAEMGNASASESDSMPYYGLTWDTAATFNTVRVSHANAGPAADGVSVYLAYEAGTWTKVTAYSVSTAYDANGNPTVTYTFSEAVTAYGVKLVQFRFANSGFKKAVINEVYVENNQAAPVTTYDVTGLNKTLTAINKAYASSNTYGYTDASWSEFTAVRTAAASAVTACGGQTVGSVTLYPTQESLDAVSTSLMQAAQGLKLTNPVNLLSRGILFWDEANVNNSSGIKMDALTDGNEMRNVPATQSNWQSRKGNYCFLQLTDPAEINELVIWSDGENATYDISYVTEFTATTYAEADALTWTPLDTELLYTVRRTTKGADPFWHSLSVSAPEGTKIAALKIVANQGDAITEVAAFYDEPEDNCLTAVKYVNDNGDEFYLTNVSKHAAEGKKMQVTYTLTQGERVITESATVNNAYAMIQLGDLYLTAADVPGGHAGDYVVGVLFTNIPEDASVSDVSFAIVS